MYLWLAAMLLGGAPVTSEAVGWVSIDRVVAVVNRDIVLQSELDRRAADREPEFTRSAKPDELKRRRAEIRSEVLRELIDALLFAQEADRLHLSVSEAEVDGAVEMLKAQNQLDDAALARALAAQGSTLPRYREELRQQLLRMRVMNVVLYEQTIVDDEAVQAAYSEAKARDPKLGGFAAESPRIREELRARKLTVGTAAWLTSRRAEAHVEVRL